MKGGRLIPYRVESCGLPLQPISRLSATMQQELLMAQIAHYLWKLFATSVVVASKVSIAQIMLIPDK